MELRQLRYFVAVVNTGSFSRAAEQLHVAQSAVSRQIQSLEEEMGVPLILRGKPNLKPTEAGLLFLERATAIVGLVRSLREEVNEKSDIPKGVLRVGAVPYTSRLFLPQAISKYRKNFPDVRMQIRTAMSGDLLERLRDDQIDLAVMHSPWTKMELITEPLIYSQMVVVMPPLGLSSHLGLRNQKVYTFAEIASLPLILTTPVNPQRLLIDREIIARGLALNVIVEADNLGTILALVRAGVGCTVIAYGAIHEALTSRVVRIADLEPPGIRTDISLVTNTRKPVTGAVRMFKEYLQASAVELVLRGEMPPQYLQMASVLKAK